MKSEPLLRWRQVLLAILIPAGLAAGAKFMLKHSHERRAAEHPDTCNAAFKLATTLAGHLPREEVIRLAWRSCRGWSKAKGDQNPDARRARKFLTDLGEDVSKPDP